MSARARASGCLEELGLPGASETAAQLGVDAEGAKAAMAAMFAASPHAFVHSVTRPVLQCIGDSDRRVPPFQAQQYHYALRERGVAAFASGLSVRVPRLFLSQAIQFTAVSKLLEVIASSK